jgi:hypothetical protein
MRGRHLDRERQRGARTHAEAAPTTKNAVATTRVVFQLCCDCLDCRCAGSRRIQRDTDTDTDTDGS